MIFRKAYENEIDQLLKEGYKVWNKKRTLEQYCFDNSKEDAYGTRYVIENNGELVSSLILLNLERIFNKPVHGIGSVLTPTVYEKKGYASELLKSSLQQIEKEDAMVFLYSEVKPAFYERFKFRVLPAHLQKDSDSICMVLCTDVIWNKLLASNIDIIPNHF